MRSGTRPRAAAGQYNRSVVVRSKAIVRRPSGGWTEGDPVDVGPIPASITPLDGEERIQAMQLGMHRPYEIEIRYREDVTGATQIIYDGRTLNVRSIVDPEERHVILIILADEVRTGA